MRKFLMIMMLMLTANVLMAKDIRTLVVTTNPQMHCPKCENQVKNGLKDLKGIKSVETSVADQTVTIQYNAKKVSEEQIIQTLDGIGRKARKLADGEKVAREAHECSEKSEGGDCK
jgi:copper chaperone CopZ